MPSRPSESARRPAAPTWREQAVLPIAFYGRDTRVVARDLIGCVVTTGNGATLAAGRIVEAEAYGGREDPASHAARGPTRRAAIMFGPPGVAYVYLIYGLNHCLNFVTERDGVAGAVLIRSLEPLAGVALMARRRAAGRNSPGALSARELCRGPGNLCRALGIDRRWNGLSLRGPRLRVLARQGPRPPLIATPRQGVRAAAERPWRFLDAASGCVSGARAGAAAPGGRARRRV